MRPNPRRLRRRSARAPAGPSSLYDSTLSRIVWRLYGGAKDLVMWYYRSWAPGVACSGRARARTWRSAAALLLHPVVIVLVVRVLVAPVVLYVLVVLVVLVVLLVLGVPVVSVVLVVLVVLLVLLVLVLLGVLVVLVVLGVLVVLVVLGVLGVLVVLPPRRGELARRG